MQMRAKRIFQNVTTNLIVQMVLLGSGLIIPHLIMKYYGSEMNGMVASITQFITYAALIELGIGNSSIIALYKPLADKNYEGISSIVTQSKKMYLNSAYIYVVIILLIAMLYPHLYPTRFSFLFIFDLVLCIGAVNAVDYFFLGKYKVLLIADQKYYILNWIRTMATVVTTFISAILLIKGYNILYAKAVAVIVHVIEAVLVAIYVRQQYPLVTYHAKKKYKIEQRWNALIHQLCSAVTYNTDLVVLTLCLPNHSLLEISVYSVYAMVAGLVTNIVNVLTTGMSASFGNMLAKGEDETVRKTFDIYEFFYFVILFIMYSCFAVLILPFVSCYTRGLEDVNYVRWAVALLFTFNGLTAQLKEVSGVVINAAGKYRETQKYAIEEAAVNIIISLLLVKPWGIIGVLTGTLISHIWMDFRFMYYIEHNLIVGTGQRTMRRIIRNFIIFFIIGICEMYLGSVHCNWIEWVGEAIVTLIFNTVLIALLNILFEKNAIRQWRKEYVKNR